jgi:N-acetylglucosaminyl-diphospho-decaprenol L-rhamnosyltransferase
MTLTDIPSSAQSPAENSSRAVSAPAAISILIVNWNGKDMLRNLLNSIEQTRGDIAVQTVVLDNASSDGSADMVAAEFPGVTLVRNPTNDGFSRGNNLAAAVATAPLLLLLNNDTIMRPGALQNLLNFMDSRPDVIAVGPKLIGSDGKVQATVRNIPSFGAVLNSIQFLRWTWLFHHASKQFKQRNWDPDAVQPARHLMAAALMIRRDVYTQLGGFDERFTFCPEDLDLCVRMADKGAIYYLPDAQITHLGRVSARANRDWAYAAEKRGWAIYVRKHHGQSAAFVYKLAITIDAPVRVYALTCQLICDWVRRDPKRIERSSHLLRGATRFLLTGLPRFWIS